MKRGELAALRKAVATVDEIMNTWGGMSAGDWADIKKDAGL